MRAEPALVKGTCVLRAAAAALSLSIAISAATAEPADRWMSDADLERTFAGAAIAGHYADGLKFREVYRPDGSLVYEEPPRVMQGYWAVEAGTFCTIYTTSPTGGCYRVRRMSANCFEFYFVARDESEAARPGAKRATWTARAWREDVTGTCQDTPIS